MRILDMVGTMIGLKWVLLTIVLFIVYTFVIGDIGWALAFGILSAIGSVHIYNEIKEHYEALTKPKDAEGGQVIDVEVKK